MADSKAPKASVTYFSLSVYNSPTAQRRDHPSSALPPYSRRTDVARQRNGETCSEGGVVDNCLKDK